jgi:hypothetical protein
MKQNKLTITVNAFFSDKYLFMKWGYFGRSYTRLVVSDKYNQQPEVTLLIVGKNGKSFGQLKAERRCGRRCTNSPLAVKTVLNVI